VVMGDGMLTPELMADVSSMAHAHGLQVEDVDLDEVAVCHLLKPHTVPSPLYFAGFLQSPSFISLGDSYCDTTERT